MRYARGLAVAIAIALLLPVAAQASVGAWGGTRGGQPTVETKASFEGAWSGVTSWVERLFDTMVSLWGATRGTIVPGGADSGNNGAGGGTETLLFGGW